MLNPAQPCVLLNVVPSSHLTAAHNPSGLSVCRCLSGEPGLYIIRFSTGARGIQADAVAVAVAVVAVVVPPPPPQRERRCSVLEVC